MKPEAFLLWRKFEIDCLFSLEKTKLQEDLIVTFQYVKSSTEKLERDSLLESVVIGKGEMGLS